MNDIYNLFTKILLNLMLSQDNSLWRHSNLIFYYFFYYLPPFLPSFEKSFFKCAVPFLQRYSNSDLRIRRQARWPPLPPRTHFSYPYNVNSYVLAIILFLPTTKVITFTFLWYEQQLNKSFVNTWNLIFVWRDLFVGHQTVNAKSDAI